MNVLLIGLCLGAGFLLRRHGVLPTEAARSLNVWLVYLAVPATTLLYVPRLDWNGRLVLPLAAPMVVWCGAWLMFRRWRLERPTRGALLLACGLGNTSFVGFPLNHLYFGDAGLALAIVSDQMTFLLLSTVGVATAVSHGDAEQPRPLLGNLLRFPPFLALLLALVAPGWCEQAGPLWQPLSQTLIPVALFSVGAQLEFGPSRDRQLLAWGLAYKLFLGPALVLALLLAGGAQGLEARVAVLEASMASMATSSVLAVQYRLNTRLVSLLIGLGVPLSLLSSHLWYRLALLWL